MDSIETAKSGIGDSPWQPRHNVWLIAFSVMLATFMEVLDTSVATVSLPHIAGNLSATTDESTWVLTSYLISNAIILPSSGWLSNLLGRKRYQLLSVTIFTLASMWCGAATSLGMLIAARVLQGAAGGGLQPVSQAVLLESFPVHKRGQAMAVYGMGIIVSPLLGPLLGGWITDNYTWRWIFYINVPVGILALLMIHTFVEDPPYIGRSGDKRIDYIGFGFLAISLTAVQVVLDKGQESDWFGAVWVRWFVAVAAVTLVAFIVRELRTRSPIVNLRVFADRNLATGTFLIGMLGVIIYGTTALLPLFLQELIGYTAYSSGLAVAPRGIGAILSMVLAARLVGRVDERILITIGVLIRGASLFMLGDLNLTMSMGSVVWPNIVNGFANGFLFVPLTTMTMKTLPNELMGAGTGLYNLLRNLGASLGISMVTTLLTRGEQAHQSILAAHLNGTDPVYTSTLQKLTRYFAVQRGNAAGSHMAMGTLYSNLVRQATLCSYIGDFRLLGYLSLLCLPFLLFFRNKKGKQAAAAIARNRAIFARQAAR
ncbi:MAG TPA: DHA2 family efflux MFS transporter permease subunit [Terracidiphilus sp.]|nr:DHA2 family efflux MFS transporter permease subunit [Terracidiphilus sp.]